MSLPVSRFLQNYFIILLDNLNYYGRILNNLIDQVFLLKFILPNYPGVENPLI